MKSVLRIKVTPKWDLDDNQCFSLNKYIITFIGFRHVYVFKLWIFVKTLVKLMFYHLKSDYLFNGVIATL